MEAKNIFVNSRGRMILNREMPADFIAASSYRSPNPPKVMMDANKIVSGSTIFIIPTLR